MERSGVIVLALVSFVTGTPYGYGVKSGAVAKAEANAASSAFGVIPAVPLSIPTGGFAGSFSKSSSSSFSSSSSSASSSSSSYSFSGSGSNGIPGFGCQSNNCKNGANSVPFTPGNGVQNNAAAQAGAVAGTNVYSGNIAGLPCQGSPCNGLSTTPNKCTSGKCQSPNGNQQEPSNVPPLSNIENNCKSGQCSSQQQNDNNPTGYKFTQTNDKTDSKSNANDETISYGAQFSPKLPDKINDNNYNSGNKNEYGGSQPDCSQGKCGPTPSENVPSGQNDIFIPHSPSDSTVTSKTSDVSNYEPACTSHNCHTGPTSQNTNNGNLPSSYNVPILGNNPDSTLNPYNKPSGTLYNLPKTTFPSGDCEGNACSDAALTTSTKGSPLSQPSSYSHSNYPSQRPQSPTINSDCTGSNCGVSNVPDKRVTLNQPSCNSPDCDKQDVAGSGSPKFDGPTTNTGFPNLGIQTGTFDSSKSTTSNVPPHTSLHYSTTNTDNGQKYTGGFGGPTGFLSTGQTPGPHTASNPSQTETQSQTHNLPNYNGISGTTGPHSFNSVPNSKPNAYGSTKPSSSLVPPHENTPTRPHIAAGSEPANDYSTPYQNIPGNNDESKLGNGHIPHHQNTATSPGIYVGSRPSDSLLPPNENSPTSSGNYVGSKPSDSHTPYQNTPIQPETFTESKPINSYSNEKSPTVPGIYSSAYAGSTPHMHGIPNYSTPTGSVNYAGSYKPNTASPPTGFNIPQPSGDITYTGGFGAPSGVLKPNEYNLPSNQPSSNHHNPIACISLSCKNEHSPSGAGAQQGSLFNGASGIMGATANAGIYTGGFGGPTGFLKPYDNNRQSKSGNGGQNPHDHTGIQDNSKSDGNLEDKSINRANGEISANDQTHGNIGTQNNAVAQANAVAFASSSAFNANQGAGSGCKSGCGSSYSTGPGSAHGTSQGIAQTAGVAHGLAGASASANSVAGAGAFGLGKTIASSSATAHASAGVKGGYGR